MPLDINSITDQAGDYFKSDGFKQIAPYLMSGGGGAVLGAILSGRRRKQDGESRLSYTGRILANALMAGGLAGGGHALLEKGWNKTIGAADGENLLTGARKADDGPLTTTAKNVLFSPLTAAGAGGAALAATHKGSIIGADPKGTERMLKDIARRFNGGSQSVEQLKLMSPAAGAEVDAAVGHLARQRAGIPSSGLGPYGAPGKTSVLKGLVSRATRRGPMSTFGQTWPRRAGRGALGLAAAGVPALFGAFLTNKSE